MRRRRRRTGLSNASAAARRLYGSLFAGVSMKNVSTLKRDEFEGTVFGEFNQTLLFVVGRSADETTAMMCAALRAALPRNKR